MEYAPLPSIRSKKCHIEKLQQFQNKVLRFINGTRLIYCITNVSLHIKFQIETISDRLMSLAKKQINTILSEDLEHVNILKTNIASLKQGQTPWQDIIAI